MEQRPWLLAAASLLLLSLDSGVFLLAATRESASWPPPRTDDDLKLLAPRDTHDNTSSSCPGYRRGVSLGSRPLEGCVTGNKVVGPVDHELAFDLIGDLDLRSCDLPEYPTAK